MENGAHTDHEKYIATMNPILEAMVTSLLLDKPEDVQLYMLDWIVGDHVKKGVTLQKLQSVLKNATKQVDAKLGIHSETTGGAESEGEETEDDEEDLIMDEDMLQQNTSKKPRTSVSAEAYGKWNVKQEFVPKEIAKSDDAKCRIRDVLQKSFLFQSLNPKELEIVVMSMEELKPARGMQIIKQGDDGDCLYVVELGTLSCKILTQNGEELTVKTCETGDAFGELALLYNCPRAASVYADSDCVLWKLDRDTFNHIVKDAASKKRERYEEFLKRVPLLQSLNAYDRSQLSDALTTYNFEAGAHVIRQGEQGDRMYILEEGAAFAWKNDSESKSVFDYGNSGDFFGELALLKNAPRAVNVTCTKPSTLVAIDRKTFKRLLGNLEDIIDAQKKYLGYQG